MQVQSPLSSSIGLSDDPPLSIFGGGCLSYEHQRSMACRELPAVRRILGTRAPQKAGGGLSRQRRRRAQHNHQNQSRRWEDDGRSLAADSNVVLPSDSRRASAPADQYIDDISRRTPRLVRQEAFCLSSTSRDWRSLDYIDDDDELYRLGLLYDESRDHRPVLSRSPSRAAAQNEIHSARFTLDAIRHGEPAYTVRVVSNSGSHGSRRRRRSGYRFDAHGATENDDEDMSDRESDEDGQYHKSEPRLRAPPNLTLDLSFTAFADNVHQAWPRRGCQDEGIQDDLYNHDMHVEGSAGDRIHYVSSSSQPMQHIIYELHEDYDHDDNHAEELREEEIARARRPGTPITQTPELVSDDEDIGSDDAEWFSLMEDGWTPIEEEEGMSLSGADGKKIGGWPGGVAINETWVVLGRGQDGS
ncbi:uncharacterized protein B0I36DRAFT_20681 [Microdochium trichocladiopsis]|uniref:Uncharacterized protein n=1 Tax=Microdochium trichocladiopsis TaxID=1682393 RepID=A0A9P8YJV6_9PEZI|nr:uncharacterized protein B0I36DRAFT_20681 [Microdochium trichocladiopsis]KAH7041223.1 hypothetical protein B0I36DRAFT_20681 [Microdochium trichocladiopsis]